MGDRPGTTATESTIVIERVFEAPRELVWMAWTEREHILGWYGPKDVTVPICEIDVRAGGRRFVVMQSTGGDRYLTGGVYREVVPPERLVYTDCQADEDGNVLPGIESLVTVTLDDLGGGRTKMTVRHEALPAASRDGASAGWNQAFDKLAAYLAEAAAA